MTGEKRCESCGGKATIDSKWNGDRWLCCAKWILPLSHTPQFQPKEVKGDAAHTKNRC